MGKTFERIHASAVGRFEQGEKIPQWIRANGGQFHRDVNERITHLIASKDAYKHNVEAVQKAKEMGTVKIVSFDWLEDSLLSPTRRPKQEAPYLLEVLINPGPKVTRNNKRGSSGKESTVNTKKRRIKDPFVTKKPAKGSKDLAPAKQRVYEDPDTGESWSATLLRTCQPPRSREKYQLTIFETLTEPSYYPTFVKYSRVGMSSVEQLAPAKSDLVLATTTFKKFFKLQTGKEWEERFDGIPPPPKMDPEGNPLPLHEGWYTFEDNTSIFTKFIKEPRPASSAEGVSTPEIGYSPNDGCVDAMPLEDSCVAQDEDSGNDGDLESLATESDEPRFETGDDEMELDEPWKTHEQGPVSSEDNI